MPSKDKEVETDGADGDPFAEEAPSETVKYVIDGWKLNGDRDLIIEGRVTMISATWTLKRGAYNSDAVTGTMRLEPENLWCPIIVPKPRAEILAAGDGLGIVDAVFQRFGREVQRKTHDLIVEHMNLVYPEPPKEGTRVEAGERKVSQQSTSAVF